MTIRAHISSLRAGRIAGEKPGLAEPDRSEELEAGRERWRPLSKRTIWRCYGSLPRRKTPGVKASVSGTDVPSASFTVNGTGPRPASAAEGVTSKAF